MKKYSILLLFCGIISFSFSSMAWWSTGHELIAQIAENNLSSTAQKKSNEYLSILITYPGTLQASKKTATFIEASTWCDVIKNCKWKDRENKEANSMFHYINPITLPNQEISAKNSKKTLNKLLVSNKDLGRYNCYTGLQSSIKTFTDKKASLLEKAVAFRFILHLVGDMHMPLHNAAPIINGINTYGGNKIVFDKNLYVRVLQTSKQKTSEIKNLHALWDSTAELSNQLPYYYMAYKQTKKQNAYIARKAKNITKSLKKTEATKKRIKDAVIMNWSIESNMLAAKFISTNKIKYSVNSEKPKKQVTAKFKKLKSYLDSAQDVCSKQIYIGGMRLAELLNAIFDPQSADKNYVSCVKKIKADKNIPTLKNLFPTKIIFKVKH